jgi:hypothetical protein
MARWTEAPQISALEGRADQRQVMEAVAQGMILDEELGASSAG